MGEYGWWIVGGVVAVWVLHDVLQKRHAILRSFPIVGHFRFWLESIGPELRQYIVTDNDEERPFSRDQRRWVYATAKKANTYFGFGTDNELEAVSNYLIIKHAAFPLAGPHPGEPGYDPLHPLPCARVLGAARGRKKAFRPRSVVNVSAMSYGSLGAPAVQAINAGCGLAQSLHNTGEGGVSAHHLHGGDLIFQMGTGYFGCRTADGRFDLDRLIEVVERYPVRAVEIKLSQGAKPGVGGFLPGAKVTREIAAVRGIPEGRDCASPAAHSAFGDVDEMLDFVERVAEATGVPVGIKSAVGESRFWEDLARLMAETGRGVDFVTVDGGEGGTGAAPLAFSDHVALPFKVAFARVYGSFRAAGVHGDVVFIGAGKLGFPEHALLAMGLGCDLINVAREAMLSIGCIQAQRCHSGHCPTGVATHNRWLARGLVPEVKAPRLANYVAGLRKELLRMAHACGAEHPALVDWRAFEVLDGRFDASGLDQVFGCEGDWGLPPEADREEIVRIMGRAGATA